MAEDKKVRARFPVQPSSLFILAVAFMVFLHILWPLARIVPYPGQFLGVLLILSGLTLIFWAATLFFLQQTPILPGTVPKRFFQDGPYRFSRNPMYLGLTLLLAGFWLLLGTLSPALVIPLFFVAINWIVCREEELLTELFGSTYLQFKSQTRRWF